MQKTFRVGMNLKSIKMKENLSDKEHLDMLANKEADVVGRESTFIEYTQLGFKPNKALKMAGFKEVDILKYPSLQVYFTNTQLKSK